MSCSTSADVLNGWSKMNFKCRICNSTMIQSQPRVIYGYGTTCKKCNKRISKTEYIYHCVVSNHDFCVKCSNYMINSLQISRLILFETISQIIPKEYILYAIQKDRELLICGYIRNNSQLHISNSIINIISNQCKLLYKEFKNHVCAFNFISRSKGWDDEDSWSSTNYKKFVIQMNGKIVISTSKSSHEMNPYGKEKSNSNSNKNSVELNIKKMNKFLSLLAKLPINYELNDKYSCNSGISFNERSITWKFNNFYQSKILRNYKYKIWNEENLKVLKVLMSVLEKKYKMNFDGVDVNKLIAK